jgi:hypothetical protein
MRITLPGKNNAAAANNNAPPITKRYIIVRTLCIERKSPLPQYCATITFEPLPTPNMNSKNTKLSWFASDKPERCTSPSVPTITVSAIETPKLTRFCIAIGIVSVISVR